jgi:serine/threonine-protein kinase
VATETRRAFGLTTRVFATTSAIVGVVVASALAIASVQLKRGDDEAMRRGLEQSADLVAQFLAGRERSLAGGARVFVQQPYFRTLVSERRREDLFDQSSEAATQLDAHWVMITDRDGVLLAKSDEPALSVDSLGGVPLVAGALRGGSTQGFGVSRDSLLFQAVGVPVVIPGQPPIGVLVATRIVDSVFAADVKSAVSSEVVFFARDRQGDLRIVASTLGRGLDVLAAAEHLAQLPPRNQRAPEAVSITGTSYVTQGASLTTAAGDVVGGFAVLRARAAVVTGLDGIRRSLLLSAALGVLLAVGMAYFAARHITAPLRRLSQSVRRAAEGDYAVRLDAPDASPGTEVDALATAFQSLLADLREKEALVASLMVPAPSAAPPPAAPQRAEPARLTLVPAGAPSRDGSIQVATGAVLADRYVIEDVLGRGGMGMVYRATDRLAGERIAIKLLRPEVVRADPLAYERFREELRLARRITHRNVVRMHDIGEHHGVPFLTMELVIGSSLADVIRRRGALPPHATIAIAKQLMRALACAHEQGVVHGDLKPHNVLITASGVLKVSDFGLARVFRDPAPNRERREPEAHEPTTIAALKGAVVGTPEYMAPELLVGNPPSPASDLYAAAMVLHECLIGQTPFVSDTPMAFFARKLGDVSSDAAAAPSAMSAVSAMGTELETLIHTMTRAEPGKRPPSAVAVLERLMRLE